MRSLKERGLEGELRPLAKRIKRAYAMGRIDRPDFLYLMEHVDAIEARIISMPELDEEGEEVGHGN